jgi:hypothetical protein
MRNTSHLKSDKTLKSGGALGGGGRSLSAKTWLKARSEKKKAWFRDERAPFVADYLERNPYCVFKLWIHGTTLEESPPINWDGGAVVRCNKKADDVHELIPQGRGGNAIPINGSEENFLPLCRFHHSYVTQNPAFSRAKGYTR